MVQVLPAANVFNFIPKKIEILLYANARAPNRMTSDNDKDMKHLSDLVSRETWQGSNSQDALIHKLLYLILEESAASRRRAEQTNRLLAEISDSLKKTNRSLDRLSRIAVPYREDDWRVRLYPH